MVKGGGGFVPIDLKKLCYTLQQWKECALRRRIFGVRPDSRALFFSILVFGRSLYSLVLVPLGI